MKFLQGCAKWIGFAVMGLILLAVIGALLTGGDDSSPREAAAPRTAGSVSAPADVAVEQPAPAEAAPPSEPEPTATEVPPAAVPTAVPALGEDVLVVDVRWKALTAELLGNTLTSENQFIDSATTMGQFVRVRFEVENRSTESLSLGGVKLVDSQGRTYERATGLTYWIPDAEYCIFETLNPNVPKVCNVIFDVAADAAGLHLQVDGLKLFRNQEALIALGF